MAESNKGKVCEDCSCHSGWYCGQGSMWFHIARWILGIIIIVMIFCLGIKVGEIKGQLEESGWNSHHYMDMNGYNRPMMYGPGYDRVVVPVSVSKSMMGTTTR